MGACSSGFAVCPTSRTLRRRSSTARKVADDAGMGTDRCWLPSCSWPRPVARGGNCRRASARPGQPRTAASPSGAGPECGASCTAWSWRARRTRRTGLVAVRDRLGKYAGPQTGDLTGPNPVDRGKKGGWSPWCGASRPSGPAAGRAAQAARRQGLRLRLATHVASLPQHHTAHRAPGHRILPAPRPSPLDCGAHSGMAVRVPPSAPSLRAQGRTLPGVRRHRRRPDLLPQADSLTGRTSELG